VFNCGNGGGEEEEGEPSHDKLFPLEAAIKKRSSTRTALRVVALATMHRERISQREDKFSALTPIIMASHCDNVACLRNAGAPVFASRRVRQKLFNFSCTPSCLRNNTLRGKPSCAENE